MATTTTAARAGGRRAPGPERIEFVANPVRQVDAALGEAAERAVERALRDHHAAHLGRVEVRFGVAPGETGGLQFVCKVECSGRNGAPPWRWWSCLTEEPRRLHDDLVDGLERRRRRLGRSASLHLRRGR
jgi:hypothetical protein